VVLLLRLRLLVLLVVRECVAPPPTPTPNTHQLVSINPNQSLPHRTLITTDLAARRRVVVAMTTAASSALPETPLAKPFAEVAKARFSNGHYKEHQPVPQHVLNDILRLTQRAPSSFNIQPYSLVVVRDPAVRARLAKEAMLGACASNVALWSVVR
jgi:hypothetical protein